MSYIYHNVTITWLYPITSKANRPFCIIRLKDRSKRLYILTKNTFYYIKKKSSEARFIWECKNEVAYITFIHKALYYVAECAEYRLTIAIHLFSGI